MEISETQLVTRAQAGDVDAFAALVKHHREPILRLLRRFAACPDDAQDLAQETFVAAFRSLGSLGEPERFSAWLRQIAVNAARQWWRRESQISFEPLWDDAEPAGSADSRSADRSASRLRDVVRDALAALPPEPRSVVLLHYFDGYDYRETAALLDVPVSTVRGRLHLARRKLKEEMAELAPAKTKTPPPPIVTEAFDLTREDLSALRGACMFASKDPERPILKTVCIEPDGTVVSTDIHRLFLSRATSIRPKSRALVSRALLECLVSDPRIETARLTLTGTEATLSYSEPGAIPPERTHRAPLVTEAQFPHYERVIPAEWRITALIAVRDLLLALEEIARFDCYLRQIAMPDAGHEGQRVSLTLSPSTSTLMLHAGTLKSHPAPAHWSLQIEVPAEIRGLEAGEEFRIAINRSYLRDCPLALNLSSSERIEMRLNEPLRPFMIQPEGSTRRLTVVMPMSLVPV